MCFPTCELLTTPSGAECIRLLIEHKPDVVILDSELEDGDGFTALSKIRSRYSGPMIMLLPSADKSVGSEIQIVQAIESGADYCMTKPIRQLEFVARVRALIRQMGGNGKRSRNSSLKGPDAVLHPKQ